MHLTVHRVSAGEPIMSSLWVNDVMAHLGEQIESLPPGDVLVIGDHLWEPLNMMAGPRWQQWKDAGLVKRAGP